ncbi:GntR family transcriptional regulator [Acuticoccus sp. I52.16.1]|uniref:GntR family transcriptional regulator n=1 Tax=Acuticoccus sp. I52.16.1 TaxID=2928472 RepID=UPI001FD46676|nr:GntR family transcriptional regulator [Acuticoccus sp. I52.16.1]UOM35800.1 GntR family transcriptional regulator [Acuticoccus sp. I52.16.1]
MSVGEKVYSTLRRRLMSGYYEPGSKLKEEVVAADLSVSRTPVRAAIHRLIAEGLLEPAPKRGALVTPWGAQDVEDIFNLRIMLEGYGASLAAKNATREEVDRLEALNEEIAAAVDSEREDRLQVIHTANLDFHTGLYEASRSPHLRTFGVKLLEYPLVIGGFYIYDRDDMIESVRQHSEIVAALRAGNPDWARAAIACHLAAAIERFRRAGRVDGATTFRFPIPSSEMSAAMEDAAPPPKPPDKARR